MPTKVRTVTAISFHGLQYEAMIFTLVAYCWVRFNRQGTIPASMHLGQTATASYL